LQYQPGYELRLAGTAPTSLHSDSASRHDRRISAGQLRYYRLGDVPARNNFGLEISMKSTKQAIENVEYVRRFLEQSSPDSPRHWNSPRRWSRQASREPMDELIRLILRTWKLPNSRQGHSAAVLT
jgi:hypothetical protein